MEVGIILTRFLRVSYLTWTFRFVCTALWRIGNITSPTGLSRLVFDGGKEQVTKKAPDLFVNLYDLMTKDCPWKTFILVRAHHNHLSITAVTSLLIIELENSLRWKITAHSAASFYGWYFNGAAPNSLVTTTSMTGAISLRMSNFGNTAITVWMLLVMEHRQLTQRIVSTLQVQQGR